MHNLLYPLLILPLAQFIARRNLLGAVAFLVSVGIADIVPKEPNYYELLGLGTWQTTAGRTEIAKAYRAQAGRLHPDVNPADKQHSHERFVQLQVAYETLSSASARRLYDLHGPQHSPEQEELLKLAIGVVVRLAVAWIFTRDRAVLSGRKFLVSFIFSCSCAELLLRFWGETTLLGSVPWLSRFPAFQQAQILTAAFPCVLSVATLVSRSQPVADYDALLLKVAAAVTASTGEAAEALLKSQAEPVESAATKLSVSPSLPRQSHVHPPLQTLGQLLFWLYIAKTVWTTVT